MAHLLATLCLLAPTGMTHGEEPQHAASKKTDGITVYPAPSGEELSSDYQVRVNGKSVFVYRARVSAIPFNQVWPGYQRPVNQTEEASFAYWDMSGPATVEVTSKRAIEEIAIRPTSYGIRPQGEKHRIVFRMLKPQQISVEVNGTHHALHLFANPEEVDKPKPDDPNVRFFGPGVHHPGRITMGSNETVYLAGGAVVYGTIHATKAKNISIRGRGILDVSPFARSKGGGAIRLSDCQNILIDGIVMRDPDVWCCSLFGCRKATISNVKLIGLWRYNADGIDLCNSQEVTVTDSFVRSFDDSIALKGLKSKYEDRPVSDIRVCRCVLWNDWGKAIEIGAETCAPEIRNVIVDGCDIIHTCHAALDILHGDRATIDNIRYENIRIEVDEEAYPPKIQLRREEKYQEPRSSYCPTLLSIVIGKNNYSKDAESGCIRNVLLKEVVVLGKRMPHSFLQGFDSEHAIQGVRFLNLRMGSKVVTTPEEGSIQVGRHVSDVEFSAKQLNPSAD